MFISLSNILPIFFLFGSLLNSLFLFLFENLTTTSIDNNLRSGTRHAKRRRIHIELSVPLHVHISSEVARVLHLKGAAHQLCANYLAYHHAAAAAAASHQTDRASAAGAAAAKTDLNQHHASPI